MSVTYKKDFFFHKTYNILWGSYPSDNEIVFLENNDVELFIDLTQETECPTYITTKKYLNYPIKDNSIPENLSSFINFINNLCIDIHNYVKLKKNIYIHCKSGKNRSGMVVVILNCIINNWSVDVSKAYIKEVINLKFKFNKDTPYIKSQNKFIYSLFEPRKFYGILSLEYQHVIEFNNIKFKNQKELHSYFDSHNLNNFYNVVLNYKYDNFPMFKKLLLENCFRPFLCENIEYLNIFIIFKKNKIKNPYF